MKFERLIAAFALSTRDVDQAAAVSWIESLETADVDRLMDSTDPELVHLLLDTGHAIFGGADPARGAEVVEERDDLLPEGGHVVLPWVHRTVRAAVPEQVRSDHRVVLGQAVHHRAPRARARSPAGPARNP